MPDNFKNQHHKKLSYFVLTLFVVTFLASFSKFEDEFIQTEILIESNHNTQINHEKDLDGRYGFIGCVIRTADGTVCLGTRCTKNNHGGCNAETQCSCVPSSAINYAMKNWLDLNDTNWDGFVFPTNDEGWNWIMWELDSNLAIHPDSL